MEIDLQLFAQRVAVIAILAGFLGGCLFVLVYGAVVAICDRLRFRPIRLRCFDRFRSRLRSSIVAFRSDAHRRWWFANRAAGGTGVLNSRSSGPGSASSGDAESGQARRDARIAYAKAMYPHLSEPDALRQLNDREGFGGLPGRG